MNCHFRVTYHLGEKDLFAHSKELIESGMGIYLIGKRVIQENSMAVLFSCDAFKQTVLDALAV